MAVAWPAGVNTNAYGMEMDPIPNVERIEFESGKPRTYLKNSAGRKRFAFILSMEDVGPDSEYKAFLQWWDETLLGGALSFLFPDLITHAGLTEYMSSDATFGVSGQRRKDVKLTVEEA